MTATSALLSVDGLSVDFAAHHTWLRVVHDVSFQIARGETVGLVGESGSGKTVTSQAVMGLTARHGGRISAGSICFDGQQLVGASDRELRSIRGRHISMVFQQAVRSLNPAYTVGDQIDETIRRHLRLSRKQARARTISLLDRVHIPNAARRVGDYPHTFSGGMLQRVLIAMAISCEPRLLIADEPTTALDVSVQASILELLADLQRDTGMSVIFISHDLAVIAELCDHVIVMYSGEVVESGTADELFVRPTHPYTAGLLASIPQLGATRRLAAIDGTVPPPGVSLPGCRFAPRCSHCVEGRCDTEAVPLRRTSRGSVARCLRVEELALEGVRIP